MPKLTRLCRPRKQRTRLKPWRISVRAETLLFPLPSPQVLNDAFAATRQGVDPQKLVHAVQEHAREERQVINNYYITGPCNVTINQQSAIASQHPERYIRPEQQRTVQPSTSRKSKVHVVPKRPVFSGPVRPRKKAPSKSSSSLWVLCSRGPIEEIVDLADVLVRAMNAPPITQPETTRRR